MHSKNTLHKFRNQKNYLKLLKYSCQRNMYKNLFLAYILIAVATSTVYLSPAYPPSAYQNQFYSVRFRIRGLDDPVFIFQGLPQKISGNQDGVLSGTPKVAGSFSIVIKYSSGEQFGSKQVILKILPDYKLQNTIVQSTQTRIGLVIQYPSGLIFRVGQTVRLPFLVKNAVGSVVWSFQGLPTGIKGNSNTGAIQGSVSDAGYYNLQVECADSQGKSAQAFVTINVQPKTSITSTKVVQVQTKSDTSSVTTIFSKIEAEQVAADNQIFKSLDNIDTRKKVVADVKKHVAVATFRVNNAQSSFDAAEAAFRQASSDKQFAQSILASAANALNAAQKNLELALIQQTNAASRLAEAKKAVDQAQQRFDAAQKAVTTAQANLVDAKDKYQQSEAALRDAKTQKAAAQQQYKRSFQALEAAKTQLEDAKAKKLRADQAVKAAKDAIELAQQARDNAQNDLKKADFNLLKAEKQLQAALKKVAAIRQKYNIAKNEYESAKWDWQTALNRLYVAQSRKQTADRASAIALAEGSLSDHNNGQNGVNIIGSNVNVVSQPTTISFGGCDSKSYPVVSGTSRIISVNNAGYSLASGHNVVYGSCSSVTKCAVGDLASYNGYLVNGVVNALRIQRVLLS